MGLDISVYEKVTFVYEEDEMMKDGEFNWERAEAEDLIHVFAYEEFKARIRDLKPGWYRTEGERFGFRAGSYSGYSHFRDILATATIGESAERVWSVFDAAKYEEKAQEGQDLPAFYELICFSDCEGCIGPSVSAKLARDFADYEEKFVSWIEANLNKADINRQWHLQSYAYWKEAFELAAKGGIVQFC